jgi:hypothetical protein
MLSHAGLVRQQARLLCYTSGVINLGCAGFGMRFEAVYLPFARSFPFVCPDGSRRRLVHVVYAAALAAGFMRSIIRVIRRGKGF